MKLVMTIFDLILLVVLMNPGFTAAQEKTYSRDDANILEYTGDAFRISLPANHSTGYRWIVEISDTTILVSEGNEYVGPPDKKLGKPGQEIWKFRGLVPGSVTVILKYAHPWEKETTTAMTAVFYIKIQ